jgi:hypothetical protein
LTFLSGVRSTDVKPEQPSRNDAGMPVTFANGVRSSDVKPLQLQRKL